jgi:hypothetical protein
MAAGRDIRAGRAFIEIGAKDRFSAALDRAAQRLHAFGAGVRTLGVRIAGLGAGLVAPFLSAAGLFAKTGSDLNDLSARTGVSTDALQELGFAASLTGASIEDLEKGLAGMARVLFEARAGSADAVESLRALGLSVADLEGLSPDQQFERIGRDLAQVSDATTRAALAMKLFGKSGRVLLPMLADLPALRAEWQKMGIALSGTDIAAADKLGDTWDALKFSLKSVVNLIGASVAPLLTDLAERTAHVASTVGAWINQNRTLVVTALKVAAGVAALGVALIAAGTAIISAAVAAKLLIVSWSGLIAVLAAAKAAMLALLSPVALVIVGITGIAAALIYTSGVGETAVSFLSSKFAALSRVAREAWSGIVDAIAAGDLALAGKIAIAGLRLAWLEGTAEIRTAWAEVVAGLGAMWVNAVAGMQRIWTNLASTVRSTFENVTSWVAKRINEVWGLFDDSFDASAANDILDRQNRGTQADLESSRQRELDAIDRRQSEDLALIGEALTARTKIAEEALAAARAELKALRERAVQARETPPLAGPERPEFDLPGIAETISRKLSTAGAFNLSAAFGLAGGPFANLEKKAEDQIRLLRQIRDNTEAGATFT